MGRETVLTAVTWAEGQFPVWTNISGEESGWSLPPVDNNIPGPGPFINEGDVIDFAPGSTIPAHFTYWRFPNESSFTISPDNHAHTLRLLPSTLNLTGLNGNYAGPDGQTFVGRRQQDTLFTYRVTLEYSPTTLDEEAGVTAFLTQNHHLDLGIVLLPANESTGTIPGTAFTAPKDSSTPIPQIRYRGISSVAVPAPMTMPVPDAWIGEPLTFEIQASNLTHFSFSVGPADAASQMQTILYASNTALSYGFTGKSTETSCCCVFKRGMRAVDHRQDQLTLLNRRHTCRHICDEQWRQWDYAGLFFAMAIHTTRTVFKLKGFR